MLTRDQRDRILVATATVVAKRGYPNTTIEHIVKRASVSRSTFYELFENREDAMLATIDAVIADVRRRVEAASPSDADWPTRTRASLAALLDYVVANPAFARTAIVESVSAGPAAVERYEDLLGIFSVDLARGRELEGATPGLPETFEGSLIGGVVWMIHQRLLHGEIDEVPAMLPTVVEFCLAPYVGQERAVQMAAPA
jgi:AcrR family transcriptional regulator